MNSLLYEYRIQSQFFQTVFFLPFLLQTLKGNNNKIVTFPCVVFHSVVRGFLPSFLKSLATRASVAPRIKIKHTLGTKFATRMVCFDPILQALVTHWWPVT